MGKDAGFEACVGMFFNVSTISFSVFGQKAVLKPSPRVIVDGLTRSDETLLKWAYNLKEIGPKLVEALNKSEAGTIITISPVEAAILYCVGYLLPSDFYAAKSSESRPFIKGGLKYDTIRLIPKGAGERVIIIEDDFRPHLKIDD